MLIYGVLGTLGLGARIELIFVLRLFIGYIFLGCSVCVYTAKDSACLTQKNCPLYTSNS
jgi:hypothetical protein